MRRRRLLFLAVLGLVGGATIPLLQRWKSAPQRQSPPPVVVETAGTQVPFWEKQFRERVREVSRAGAQVRIVSDGTFRGSPDGVLLLSPGDAFNGPPDHHAHSTFTVQALGDEGVTVVYESRFNHVSFGKNQISIDRGALLLPWRTPSTVPAQLPAFISSSPP